MDALDTPNPETELTHRVQLSTFIAALASAPSFAQPAVGLGKDVRFTGNQACGAALWAEDRYVHVCGFASNGHAGPSGFRTRMSRRPFSPGFR